MILRCPVIISPSLSRQPCSMVLYAALIDYEEKKEKDDSRQRWATSRSPSLAHRDYSFMTSDGTRETMKT
jgi:hypothetical protein